MGLAGIFGQSWSSGKSTQAADTKITVLVPPKKNKKTKICQVEISTLGTAHVVTYMRPLGLGTTLSAAAAAAQAVINLTADPGNYSAVNANASVANNLIAAGDYLVIEKPDGTYHVGIVSSVATLAITLTANVPTGGFASGAKVWFFGVAADLDPRTGLAHAAADLFASTYNAFSVPDGSIAETLGMYEPILVQVNNATAASTVELLAGVYGP